MRGEATEEAMGQAQVIEYPVVDVYVEGDEPEPGRYQRYAHLRPTPMYRQWVAYWTGVPKEPTVLQAPNGGVLAVKMVEVIRDVRHCKGPRKVTFIARQAAEDASEDNLDPRGDPEWMIADRTVHEMTVPAAEEEKEVINSIMGWTEMVERRGDVALH